LANAEEEPYARALDDAFRKQLIREPGKYGIVLSDITTSEESKLSYVGYSVFAIIEDEDAQ
jgi:hypothetical protein